jgi:hypothetical protein
VDYRVGGKPGGIQSLLALIREHREAIQYDLLSAGLRLAWLGTPLLGWDDFAVWVKFLPRQSQTAQEALGPSWPAELHLLANVADLLAWSNWQRGGGKGPKPKPTKRPGDKSSQTFGRAVPIDDVRQFLTERNGRAPGG